MKIAMISYHTCPLASQEGKETGGMNIYLLELSKELVKKGHVVDIFTRSQDVNHQRVVPVIDGLRVVHLPAGPQKTLPKQKLLPFLDEFVENYKEFVAKENNSYDILHCHYYQSGLAGLKIKAKNGNIPFIMSFHTLALLKNLVARSEQETEDQTRIDAEFLLTVKADKVITSNETDSRYMQYFYNAPPSKLTVIPPGIDASRFYPMDKSMAKEKIGEDLSQKIVLFVGRIEPLKGVDALIYAIKIIATRKPDLPVRLLIVGGDVSQTKELWTKELQRLEQLRNMLHIPCIVEFVGQRTQEELPFYYNSAEVLVMPSHYESFGIAAIEAMACGTPVITSNVTGVASIIDQKHASLITSVNNPLLLASQIEKLLTDSKTHEKVSQEGIKNVSDLTWANTANKMIEVYTETAQPVS
jgi:D-inositol-3-phosphate glycosyltransferase